MAGRVIDFAKGSPAEPQRFALGPPIACASNGAPFAIVEGSAELYLRHTGGQAFLGVVEAGRPVFPALPEGGQFVLVARRELAVAPHAKEQLAQAFEIWRTMLSQVEGEFDGPDALNAALLNTLESAATARDAAALERLHSARDIDGASGGPEQTVGELLQVAAQALSAPGTDIAPGERTTDLAQVPRMAQSAGLASRWLTLPRDWYLHQQGPLILREAETGHLYCAVWRKKAYALADGPPLNRETAARFERTGYEIYAPLPDGIDGFWSMGRQVLRGNFYEIRTIALAAAIMAILGALVPLATGWILSDIAPSGDAGLLVAVALALFFAAFVTYLLSALRGMATSRIQGKTSARLAASVTERVLRMPTSFFRELTSGDLNQRISAIDGIRELVMSIALSAGLSAVLSVFYFGVLVWYGIGLALIALALVSVYIAIVAVTRVLQVPLIREAYAIDGILAEQVFELISAAPKLRSAAAEKRALSRWSSTYGEERALEYRAGVIASIAGAISDSWQAITQVILFAGVATLAADTLDAGSFIAFLIAFGSFQGALVALSAQMIELYAAQPQFERARPILEGEAQLMQGRSNPGNLAGAIEIRDVSFGYDESQPPVLSGVSLKIEPGRHFAIVGGSGSGKSTLLRLLLGFETPGRGSIHYDGKDLAQLDQSQLRSQVGVVLQSSSLFAGSIIDNMRGAHDASLEECLAAAARAGLASDLESFPMGIHTPITEGASVLSGGQRQRILIARSLIAEPKILFFDEATSALDNQSQALVAETLDGMEATRITIAHRLSTIANADCICVLQGGRIVEQGRYEELMQADGEFAALARRQLMEE